MTSRIPWILTAVLAAALALTLWAQGARIHELESQLLGNGETQVVATETGDTAGAKVTSTHSGDKPLVVRLQRLETAVELLQARVGKRKERKHHGAASAAFTGGPGHRGRLDLDSHNVIDALESNDPDVRDRLGSLLRDEMDEQRESRREERREQRRQRAEEVLRELAEEHGFSDTQYQGMSDLLSDERDEISGIFQAAREDHSYGEARDKAHEIREETAAQAESILSEEQYAAWEAKREEEMARYYGRRRH